MNPSAITVLGAGSWGTALALLLAKQGHQTLLWAHDEKHVAEMATTRQNARYLPQVNFPVNLSVTDDLANAVSHSEVILIAVPSHAFISLCQQLKPLLISKPKIVWATKGLSADSTFLSHEIQQLLGQGEYAVLSGPSFAKEVAHDLPTAVTLASEHAQFATQCLGYFHGPTFRVYLSDDMLGVQWCATVKNVLAIATGISDGLNFGANARAALITRGLVEMQRLGLALGAKKTTFTGLAGMGDLVLTCTDNQSRNRRFGLALGQGQTQAQAKQAIGQVVEGCNNVEQVIALAKQNQIDMPISEHVHMILQQGEDPKTAVTKLMAREPKWE